MSDTLKMVGSFLFIAIGVIVGLSLLTGGITANIGDMTNTVTVANQSVTAAAELASVEISGKEVVGTPVIINATGGESVLNNFTFASAVGSDGQKSLFMTTVDNATYAGLPVKVTYTYLPDGYAEDAASRAILPLILIFFALGIALIAFPNLKEFDFLN